MGAVCTRCRLPCLKRSRLPHFQMTEGLQKLIDHSQLTEEELAYFYGVFLRLDHDRSGTVEFDEFFSFLKEPRSTFQDTMFGLMLKSGSQPQLDFTAWMIAIFRFCFTTEKELIYQIFQAYDSLGQEGQKKGFMNLADVNNFLGSIHVDNAIFPVEVVTALQDICLKNKGRMEFDDFERSIQRYPMLLWPIFRVQTSMRNMVIGERLFKQLDARSGAIVPPLTHEKRIRGLWKKRRDQLLLWLCGWPCCNRKRRAAVQADAERKLEEKRKQNQDRPESKQGQELREKDKTKEALLDLVDESEESEDEQFVDLERDEIRERYHARHQSSQRLGRSEANGGGAGAIAPSHDRSRVVKPEFGQIRIGGDRRTAYDSVT